MVVSVLHFKRDLKHFCTWRIMVLSGCAVLPGKCVVLPFKKPALLHYVKCFKTLLINGLDRLAIGVNGN